MEMQQLKCLNCEAAACSGSPPRLAVPPWEVAPAAPLLLTASQGQHLLLGPGRICPVWSRDLWAWGETVCAGWSLLGSCTDWLGFGAPVLVGKGNALDQGVRSKVGESVGTFSASTVLRGRRLVVGLMLSFKAVFSSGDTQDLIKNLSF